MRFWCRNATQERVFGVKSCFWAQTKLRLDLTVVPGSGMSRREVRGGLTNAGGVKFRNFEWLFFSLLLF